MALSSRTGDRDPLSTVIKEAIERTGTAEDGAPVDAALTDAVHASAYSQVDVEDAFEDMKKRGEVYVVPAEDEARVKVTP